VRARVTARRVASARGLILRAVSSRQDWQRRLGPLYGGAVALVCSTPWRWPTEVGDDARSAGWVVALGVPIGLLAWVVAALSHAAGIPAPLAAILGLAMLSVGGAALIERGLVERIDHWHGHARADRATTAIAVLALVLVTIVRAGAAAAVAREHWLFLFLAVAVSGRWAAILLQSLGDPIRAVDGRRSLVAIPAPAWLTAAISGAVAVLVIFALGKAGIVALALAALAAFGFGLEAQRRDGGLSAPVVAFTAAVAELLVLLVATIVFA
jgi:adenosylcobinamide-GDP ribazoletransferase